MKVATTSLCVHSGAIFVTLLGMTGCKDRPPPGILKEFGTPDWAGDEGMLIVKTQTPDSDILLVRRKDPGQGVNELFGIEDTQPDFESDEVIYRYDPSKPSDELEAVDLRTWVEATGPEWWDLQQERRVPDRMRVGLITDQLSYGPNEVPVEGNQIVHMAQSMHPGSSRVAILSAKRKTADYKTMKEWGTVRLKDFYHQAYDTKELKPVGVPVPLPFQSELDRPSCAWAGRDTYVVYTDMYYRRLCIVHMNRMPADSE